MNLADIQKAVLSFVLDSPQGKAHQRSLLNSDEGPKFFLHVRAGPLELDAGQNFDEVVGRVSEDHLEEDCSCGVFSHANDSRWRELGYHFYNPVQAVARFKHELPADDHIFGLRNVGTQPGTAIRHLSNLVMLGEENRKSIIQPVS